MAKVLVVDDVPDNVKLLAYELLDGGYEVVTAYDGRQALEVARSERPDVVLLDIMLPGMDGIEVCRRLKADPDLRPVPVIMISAREHDDDVVRGLDAGAHDYVTKPFNSQIVMARVRSAARAKSAHDLIAEMNERLSDLVVTDGLTGVRNHRHFREALGTAFSLAARQGMPLSVVMLDVDRFKAYNDSFGHQAGDAVLCAVATTLRDATRPSDVVARYGGEEFVVLLPATAAGDALAMAERLRAAIEGHDWPLRPVTASFGVATSDPKTESASMLVDEADRALYLSKERGRNRVTHSRDPAPAASDRLAITLPITLGYGCCS